MQRHRVGFLFLLLVASGAMGGASAVAAAPFAVTATNLTMPADSPVTISGGVRSFHLGSSQYTVTGVPGGGTLSVTCQYAGTDVEA
jgi:hypothetical protein